MGGGEAARGARKEGRAWLPFTHPPPLLKMRFPLAVFCSLVSGARPAILIRENLLKKSKKGKEGGRDGGLEGGREGGGANDTNRTQTK